MFRAEQESQVDQVDVTLLASSRHLHRPKMMILILILGIEAKTVSLSSKRIGVL